MNEIQLNIEESGEEAKNLCRIDGINVILDLVLNSKFDDVKRKASINLALILRNNHFVQNHFIEKGILEVLMQKLNKNLNN